MIENYGAHISQKNVDRNDCDNNKQAYECRESLFGLIHSHSRTSTPNANDKSCMSI